MTLTDNSPDVLSALPNAIRRSLQAIGTNVEYAAAHEFGTSPR